MARRAGSLARADDHQSPAHLAASHTCKLVRDGSSGRDGSLDGRRPAASLNAPPPPAQRAALCPCLAAFWAAVAPQLSHPADYPHLWTACQALRPPRWAPGLAPERWQRSFGDAPVPVSRASGPVALQTCAGRPEGAEPPHCRSCQPTAAGAQLTSQQWRPLHHSRSWCAASAWRTCCRSKAARSWESWTAARTGTSGRGSPSSWLDSNGTFACACLASMHTAGTVRCAHLALPECAECTSSLGGRS